VRSTGGEKYRFKKINIAKITFANGRYLFPKTSRCNRQKTGINFGAEDMR